MSSEEPSASPEISTNLASLPFTRGDLHILAVDDDPVQLKVVTQSLEKLGYKVTTANNGKEALDVLNTGVAVDLILSDVMMPIMNGSEFLTAARSDPRFVETPIVMMSSNDQYEIVFDCLSKGADDYMIKPLSTQVLKNIYANVWIKRRQNAAAAKIQHQIVESSVITKRIEEMKMSFQQSVNTPLKDVATALEKMVKDGAIGTTAAPEVLSLVEKLKGLNEGEISSAPKTQIPAKMQDFFAAQFGVGAKSSKVVTPVAVNVVRKRAAPAPVVPHLAPLNLGEKLLSLDFNVWNVNENMLCNLANDLLGEMNLAKEVSTKPGDIEYFLRKAMQAHKPNPFHNFRRACDCLQFVVAIMKKIKVEFTPAEVCGAVLAALLHDVDHPGTNNLFQIRTSSQIAITYNDRSVLENNSAAVGSKLLQDCFTFSGDSRVLVDSRAVFLNCILKTDYSKLQKFLGKVLAHEMDWNNKQDRFNALALLVLMGDLSFALRQWDVAGYWYGMMRDEQLQQGDMERRLGMPVAALMDRRQQRPQALLIKTHFDVMVLQVFQAGVKIFPELEGDIMTALQRNLQIVEELETVESQPVPPPSAK